MASDEAAAGSIRPRDQRWPTAAEWLSAGPRGTSVDLAVLGVPAFATSISRTGAHRTPEAVRRALERLSTWSSRDRVDLAELSAWDLGDVEDPDLEDGEWRTTTRTATAVGRADLTVVLGGDNSVTCAAALGTFGDDLGRAGLVTLDAHHDIREGRSNGSPVRRLLQAGLDPTRVVQVGIADWANSASYGEQAASLGIGAVMLDEIRRRGIEACVSDALAVAAGAGGPVYVDLDLDVCDRSVAPACPASLPGGLSAGSLLAAAEICGRHPAVRALDLVEVDATADPDGRTVRLMAMCLLQAALGLLHRGDRA